MDIAREKINQSICGECDEPVLEDQASCICDGERCHLDCAARAEDDVDFDNWFINR